jgi:GAF domain-containing protein
MQIHATQNAFIVLLAQMISGRLELNTILALTLEQAVPLLNAFGGEVWLLSPDGQWLELVSTLSSSMSTDRHQPVRLEKGRGLKGWVIDQGRPLQIQIPSSDPRFEPEVDQVEGMVEYAWLAVPLQHRNSTIGLLTIYNKNGSFFSNRDIELLEGIASLTASAIVNAQLMQELRDYGDQQRILYEMSQQIAAGLDLPTTLNRILHWLGRLFAAEIGTLWLVDNAFDQDSQAEKTLRLVTALGLALPDNQNVIFSLEQGLVGWVVRTGETAMVNDLADEPRFDYSLSEMLNFSPRNTIAVPMIYHDQTIGAICLLNKIGNSFTEADLTLLSTVADIVAVAVGNATLHTQTLALLDERERLNKQILQSERLAIVGRLTASLSHEINNPMQAIHGALTLALEELDNPQELSTYIQMSLKESKRVVQLISRMRQIYRPQGEAPEQIDLNLLLQEVITIARKELRRRSVTLQVDLAHHLPLIVAIPSQLHLVFLSLILNLGDAIGAAGGGELTLQSWATAKDLVVKLTANAPSITLPDVSQQELSSSLGLSLSYDIIAAHSGTLHFSQQDQQIICRIDLPLSPREIFRG